QPPQQPLGPFAMLDAPTQMAAIHLLPPAGACAGAVPTITARPVADRPPTCPYHCYAACPEAAVVPGCQNLVNARRLTGRGPWRIIWPQIADQEPAAVSDQ